MVYTSPNWNRIRTEKGLNVTSKVLTVDGKKDTFFDHEIESLENRVEFRKFLYAFVLRLPEGQNEALKNYVKKAKERKFNTDEIPQLTAENGYIDLEANQITLEFGGIPYKGYTRESYESDFFIKGNTPSNPDFDDQRTPIVIQKGMNLNGKKYFGTSTWTSSLSIPVIPINLRRIPGTTIQYPYLTTEDFFEDKLIQIDNNINNDAFYSSNENINFLLPLKLLFFDYFNPESIPGMLEFNISQSQGNTTEDVYTLTLKIPVTNRNRDTTDYVSLVKEYKIEDILNFQKARFRYALTPNYLYKIGNNPDKSNSYSAIAVYESSKNNINDVNLNFYYSNDITYPENAPANFNFKQKIPFTINEEKPGLNNDAINNTSVFYNKRVVVPKTTESTDNMETLSKHYYIKRYFDYIRVEINNNGKDYSGIICPRFKLFDNHERTQQITVAIDFGTSNTFVAIKKGEEIKPLELTNIKLVSILNSIGFENIDSQFKSAIKNEFMPPLITSNDNDHYVSFPNRTVMYECTDQENLSTSLFLKSNIAYFFESEETGSIRKGVKPITNIKPKFDANTGAYYNLVANYIKQLLLIIKYKVLAENGDLHQLKIRYTYPATGRETYKDDINSIINLMSKEVFGLRQDSKPIVSVNPLEHSLSESEAPLYYIKKMEENLFDGGNIINIDIGGGTTDFVFYLKDENTVENKCRISSVRFAGNDLWGNYKEDEKTLNGFLKAWEKYYSNDANVKTTNAYKRYERLKSSGDADSSDLINLLFRYDRDLKFSGIFENYEQKYNLFKFPLFLHFSTIVYFALLNLKKIKDEGVNYSAVNCFSFTGKGSTYLKILFKKVDPLTGEISVDTQKMKNFILKMVKNFNNLKGTNITVNNEYPKLIHTMSNPKEVTAYGALNWLQGNQIPNDDNYRNLLSVPDNLSKVGFELNGSNSSTTDKGTSSNSSENDLKQEVIKEHEGYIKLFFGGDYITSYDYGFIENNNSVLYALLGNFLNQKDGLKSTYGTYLNSSYNEYIAYCKSNHINIDPKESRFFFAYKSLLFNFSNELFNQIERKEYDQQTS
jgi:hypothetical protein